MAGPILRIPGQTRRKPGVVFLCVFVLPLLGWGAYNWWDEPLTPTAQSLLDAKPEAVPDSENLFLAILGFSISGEEPAHERGAAALDAYAKIVAKGGRPLPRTYAEAMDRSFAAFDEEGVVLCSAGNVEGAYQCLRNSRAQREGFQPLVIRLSPLLLRYHELESYPRYVDPRVATADDPMDNLAFRVGLVNLSVLALAAEEGAVEPAVVALGRSASVWRRVLAARNVSLVDKLVASRAYSAHLLFASELIRELSTLEGPVLESIESIVRPLQDAEISLAGPFASEFRMQAGLWARISNPDDPMVLRDFPSAQSWWYRLLVKKNETTLRSLADLEAILAIEKKGCVDVKAAVEKAEALPPPSGSGLSWFEWGYNPIGRLMHASMDSRRIYVQYLGRQCNLTALQGMVGLQLELRRHGATADSTPSQIKSLGERFQDPNTGQPYAYDARAQTLGFGFIGKNKEFTTPLPLRTP